MLGTTREAREIDEGLFGHVSTTKTVEQHRLHAGKHHSQLGDWLRRPGGEELRGNLHRRGLTIDDVLLTEVADRIRVDTPIGRFDPGDVSQSAAFGQALDAVAIWVTRDLMIRADGCNPEAPPAWAMTMSSYLDWACDCSMVSPSRIRSLAIRGYGEAARAPASITQTVGASVQLFDRQSRIAFQARLSPKGTRTAFQDLDGLAVYALGAGSYPTEMLARMIGRPLSSVVSISSVPLIGVHETDPLIISATAEADNPANPGNNLRLGIASQTVTLELAPGRVMQAVGLGRHVHRSTKPWIEASQSLSEFRKP